VGRTDRPPNWIKPQLTRLVEGAPAGDDWVHEVKYDGYRMHARLRREARALKEVVAEQALELRLLKKSTIADGGDEE
jgi:hypothetical protein